MYRTSFALFLIVFAGKLWAVDTVVLSFDWKPGTYAEVTGYSSTEKLLAGESQSVNTVEMSYIMSTKAHENGMQVDFLNTEVAMSSSGENLPPFMKSYMETLTEAIPSYIINPEGEVVGIARLELFRNNVVSGLDDILKDTPEEVRQQLMSGLQQVFSEEVLGAQIEEEWLKHVGQWIGAEFDDDGVYQVEYEAPVPMLNNQMVKTAAEYEFVERVNCDARDQASSCVVLLYRTQTDDVAVGELLRRMTGDLADVQEMKVSVTTEMELVTDPRTLLTYYVRTVERATAPVQTADGTQLSEEVEISEFDYLYVKGAR
ncbi:MAG: hypothetical protein AAGI88_19950 [Pseudomonadota bacterium]